MKRLTAIITLLLCMGMLFSCGGAQRYSSLNFGFSADYPAGWTVSEDETSVCFSTPDASASDDFYENVIYTGAIVLKDSGASDLDGFAALVAEGISTNTADYTELLRERTTVAGLDCVKLVYTCTSSQTSYVIKQCMYLLCDGELVHNIVYTANSETYDTYAADADAIAGSFKVN
ncbi:MAG: hypothetical protein IJ493_04715 [Clostridia bacterium]|nr:hypothetical protein [Clostridia bacterium]